MSNIEAWVIHAEAPGRAPRSTDDPFFQWQRGEAIVVLPADASPQERAAALAAAAQMSHFADQRTDVTDFADRDGYFYGKAVDEYFDALHPYLAVSPARNLYYAAPGPGESRGRVLFEIIPFDER